MQPAAGRCRLMSCALQLPASLLLALCSSAAVVPAGMAYLNAHTLKSRCLALGFKGRCFTGLQAQEE